MSKRYKSLFAEKNKKAIVDIDEAIKMVKKNCNTKFNESIDVSINLNLKQKKEEFNIRTVVNLPHGNGKVNKVAVLCEEHGTGESLEAENEEVGNHARDIDQAQSDDRQF